MFYNQIYVPEMKTYIVKFTTEVSINLHLYCGCLSIVLFLQNNSPPLSPLPRLAANPISPFRRVSTKHSIYISPLKTANFPPSPNRPLSYSFLRSPAKDLRAINSMMKMSSTNGKKVSKRICLDENEAENSPTKRLCPEKLVRLQQNIYSERQFAGVVDNSSSDGPDNDSEAE